MGKSNEVLKWEKTALFFESYSWIITANVNENICSLLLESFNFSIDVLDSYIGGNLTFERFQNKKDRVCNSRKLYMQYAVSCRDFYLEVLKTSN